MFAGKQQQHQDHDPIGDQQQLGLVRADQLQQLGVDLCKAAAGGQQTAAADQRHRQTGQQLRAQQQPHKADDPHKRRVTGSVFHESPSLFP